MHITRIEIENIRSIKKVEWELPPHQPSAGWHVIIGDNGSGKTSFIRAVALALVGPASALALRRNWGAWIRESASFARVVLRINIDKIFDRYSSYHNYFRTAAQERLAFGLPEERKSQLLQTFFSMAAGIADENLRYQALISIAPKLPSEQRDLVTQQALQAAQHITSKSLQYFALAEICPLLPLEQELEVAQSIANENFRSKALAAVVVRLPIQKALEIAWNISNDLFRCKALVDIALRASSMQKDQVLEQALDIAHGMAEGETRSHALATIAPHLSTEQRSHVLHQALETAQKIDNDNQRYRALARILPNLPENEQLQVLTPVLNAISGIETEDHRSYAIENITSGIPSTRLQQVLEIAQTIETEPHRSQALTTIVAYLPSDQRTTILKEVIEATRKFSENLSRFQILARVAPYLPDKLLQDAVEAAQGINDEDLRYFALAKIAPHLPVDLLQEQLRNLPVPDLVSRLNIEIKHSNGGYTVSKVSFDQEPNAERYLWGSSRGWFSAAYGSFRRIGTGVANYDELLKSNPNLVAHLSIFEENSSFSDCVDWLKDLRLKQYEAKSDRGLVDDIRDFVNHGDFLPYSVQMKSVGSNGVIFSDCYGVEIPIEELSDGYRSILGTTLDLLRQMSNSYPDRPLFSDDYTQVTPPGVVLIDEIDAHLHPSWQRRIGRWFRTHFPNIQFIVTTHSPFVCQAADVGTVFRLPKPGSGEAAAMVTGGELDRLLYGNVLDAYSTDLFGTGATRSEQSRQKLDRLAELNIAELDRDLTPDEQQEQERLRAMMPTAAYTVKVAAEA